MSTAPSDPLAEIIAAILPLLDAEGETPNIDDRTWWEHAHEVAAPHLPAKLSHQAELRAALEEACNLREGPEHVAAWAAMVLIDEHMVDFDRVAQDLDDIKARVAWISLAAERGFKDLDKMPAVLLRDIGALYERVPPPAAVRAA